jgi:hypothetical protein
VTTFAMALMTPGLSGCGGPPVARSTGMPQKETVKVAGAVRYRDKPVANASLALRSADGAILARGRTDGAGRFAALSTYGTDDGAPPGRYRVMVAVSGVEEIAPGVLAPEPPGGFVSPIPPKYASLDSSDLEVEIAADGAIDLAIDLK